MNDPGVLEVSLHIAATPETVFPYFTDPARYARWMGTPVILDPAPGSTYRVTIREDVEASGHFLEIDPPRRLAFTWGWTRDDAVPPGSTRVVVTLEPEGGGTRVVLRHHGLPDDHQVGQHRKGWEIYLARLVVVVGGGDPGPDPHA